MSPAKRLITIDIAPATETHCGECPHARVRTCDVFGMRTYADQWDAKTSEWRRMPECIAAEGKRE